MSSAKLLLDCGQQFRAVVSSDGICGYRLDAANVLPRWLRMTDRCGRNVSFVPNTELMKTMRASSSTPFTVKMKQTVYIPIRVEVVRWKRSGGLDGTGFMKVHRSLSGWVMIHRGWLNSSWIKFMCRWRWGLGVLITASRFCASFVAGPGAAWLCEGFPDRISTEVNHSNHWPFEPPTGMNQIITLQSKKGERLVEGI